jgi:hypothetical protein
MSEPHILLIKEFISNNINQYHNNFDQVMLEIEKNTAHNMKELKEKR